MNSADTTRAAGAPPDGPFHEGEIALQNRAGVRERMAQAGSRVIRDFLTEQHRAFFTQLPFLIAGSVDEAGQPWASVLAGAPGFVSSPDPHTLAVGSLPASGDPLAAALKPGAPLALLGIEPATRRRNRANGSVLQVGTRGFSMQVMQSFGNCPKYIQARETAYTGHGADALTAIDAPGLTPAARRMVAQADTFFIASSHPAAGQGSAACGVDVSHRGGKPGFVRLEADGSLAVPDYPGNSYFNTLGNLTLNPQAGLLFIDFESGDLLFLAARASISWEPADERAEPGGPPALRMLRLEPSFTRLLPGALPLRFGPATLSPALQDD